MYLREKTLTYDGRGKRDIRLNYGGSIWKGLNESLFFLPSRFMILYKL